MASPKLGQRLALISQSSIHYGGVLCAIDPEQNTLSLKDVWMLGTEHRPAATPIQFAVFKASEIADLAVYRDPEDAPPPVEERAAGQADARGSAPLRSGGDGMRDCCCHARWTRRLLDEGERDRCERAALEASVRALRARLDEAEDCIEELRDELWELSEDLKSDGESPAPTPTVASVTPAPIESPVPEELASEWGELASCWATVDAVKPVSDPGTESDSEDALFCENRRPPGLPAVLLPPELPAMSLLELPPTPVLREADTAAVAALSAECRRSPPALCAPPASPPAPRWGSAAQAGGALRRGRR